MSKRFDWAAVVCSLSLVSRFMYVCSNQEKYQVHTCERRLSFSSDNLARERASDSLSCSRRICVSLSCSASRCSSYKHDSKRSCLARVKSVCLSPSCSESLPHLCICTHYRLYLHIRASIYACISVFSYHIKSNVCTTLVVRYDI